MGPDSEYDIADNRCCTVCSEWRVQLMTNSPGLYGDRVSFWDGRWFAIRSLGGMSLARQNQACTA